MVLGEEEASLCASLACVCLFCTCWFLSVFFLSLGVGEWLRFVIVALVGLFYYRFLLPSRWYCFQQSAILHLFWEGRGGGVDFTHFKPSQSLGGAKTGDPREKKHMYTHKQKLACLTFDQC